MVFVFYVWDSPKAQLALVWFKTSQKTGPWPEVSSARQIEQRTQLVTPGYKASGLSRVNHAGSFFFGDNRINAILT